jgi:hypothetical protein
MGDAAAKVIKFPVDTSTNYYTLRACCVSMAGYVFLAKTEADAKAAYMKIQAINAVDPNKLYTDDAINMPNVETHSRPQHFDRWKNKCCDRCYWQYSVGSIVQ